MREILYIQAGNLANHVGAHFWNAQESYFTYGEDAEDPIVNHDISFREGLAANGEPAFFPRLLVFDRKSNIGSLSDLYGESETQNTDELLEWDGGVVEYRQDLIPKSEYHNELDTAGDQDGETHEDDAPPRADETKVRYWSDYSRVTLHPRSIQRLPDPADWEAAEGDWTKGLEEFSRLEEDEEFMDETFRAFVEECDNLQGLQVTNDTSTFGSFTHALLTQFRDEFVKLPCLSFPILSGVAPGDIGIDDSRSVMKALNDAFCLRSFSELSTITVPVQQPSTWTAGSWMRDLHIDLRSPFQSSALLATHIENATLPMRLKSTASTGDMSSLCLLLNWRENTKFASLSGTFPISESGSLQFERDVYARIYDFSSTVEKPSLTDVSSLPFARLDITRGFTNQSAASYNEWADQFQPPPFSVHAPAYNIPTSFPQMFEPAGTPRHTAGAFSCITTSPRSGALFSVFGSFADACLRRHSDVVSKMGLERDDVQQLRDELLTLEDVYQEDKDMEGVEAGDDF